MRLTAVFLCIAAGLLTLAGVHVIKKEPFMKNAVSGYGVIERIISDENFIKYVILYKSEDGEEIRVPSCEYEKTEKYKEGDKVAIRISVFRVFGKPIASVRLKSQAVKKTDRSGMLVKAAVLLLAAGAVLLVLALTV